MIYTDFDARQLFPFPVWTRRAGAAPYSLSPRRSIVKTGYYVIFLLYNLGNFHIYFFLPFSLRVIATNIRVIHTTHKSELICRIVKIERFNIYVIYSPAIINTADISRFFVNLPYIHAFIFLSSCNHAPPPNRF